MNARLNIPLRIAAVAATTAVVGAMTTFPAAAADGDVQVVNTETIQVYTSPTGEVQTKRVYEQLAMTGNGTVDVANPISTDGLRNLDGFGGFDVKDGQQIAEMKVSGEEHLRSVSDFTGDLPLDISIAYFINGRQVEPGDVVGKSGELEVKFTVKNVTAAPQEVSFPDGTGGTITKTVDVPIPMVGSLSTTAPSNFTNVASESANMAGDGKGGTKLSFTMTLFPPIGSDTAEFGYTADITDGIVPEASISALPVNPMESPTFASAASSYKGGADTGIELTDGATQIDANLLKLRDGAGELLAGLIKLRNGAQELEAGLAGEAAPGAGLLAAGATELNGGLNRIDEGANKLSDGAGTAAAGGSKLRDGAGQLADGADAAADGADKLNAGAGKLNAGVGDLGGGAGRLDAGAVKIAKGQAGLEVGLTTLYKAVESLPETVKKQLDSNTDYKNLLLALDAIATGIGSVDDSPAAAEPTLLGGLNAVQYAMRFPAPPTAKDCQEALVPGGSPSMCGAMDGVEFVAGQLRAGVAELKAGLVGPGKPLTHLYGISNFGGTACPDNPDRPDGFEPPPFPMSPACNQISGAYYGLFGLTAESASVKLGAAADGLDGIARQVDEKLLAEGEGLDLLRAGLTNGDYTKCLDAKQTTDEADDCGVKEGAKFLQLIAVPMLVEKISENISQQVLAGLGKPTPGCDPEETLRCAAAALADGGSELSIGMSELVKGVGQLQAGSAALSTGAGELSGGLNRLDAGAGELAGGTVELEDGLNQLSDGAGELSAGTGTAADGSGKLADGANELAAGLGDAAEGSGLLAGGLEDAAEGAPALKNGAQRLSDEGTSKLIEAGEATAQNYGELYATIEAGAERASTEKMAFGAPEGASGLTAYTFEIQGEDGEGGRNLARGLGGLAVLGLGGAAFAVRRGMV